ncbi:hypothetical protein [Winogradskyella sp. SYSU M77433]|uniref:hypothetical protein n=1 Tax=Winogradskyella sp. SYSU M77433 TaxID=3042722 RepID=UPI002480B5F5|nr:hypothetical protein [Winogradskyella sp. SYSU M77433]MDH7914622.1 hypothetical protein [Winogradskyella sp. SYSU M77433]
MKRKSIIYILIFTILFLLLFLFNKWEVSLGITFILFCFFHIFQSIKNLSLKEKNKSFLNFLFCLFYIPAILKINYSYYNLLFPIIILLLGFYVKSKITLKENYIFIFYFLISINILSVVIPDKYVLKLKLDDYISWRADIKWENFKDKKNDNYFAASIFTNFGGKVNKVYNYPQGIVYAVMSEKKSWISTNFTVKNDSNLLIHEQGHFDIAEIYAKKAQDSINQVWGLHYSKIESIVNYFITKESLYQKEYDSITDHGFKENEQKQFNKKILNLLDQ